MLFTFWAGKVGNPGLAQVKKAKKPMNSQKIAEKRLVRDAKSKIDNVTAHADCGL
jgi:hypothetical protein